MDTSPIAIFSDVHANLEALTAFQQKLAELNLTQYVCLGDIVGYNANPKECLDIVRSMPLLGLVKGNHDEYTGSDKDLTGFNPQAASAVQWTRNQLDPDDRKWLANLEYEKEVKCVGLGVRPFRIVHGTLDDPRGWGYIFNKFQAEASMEYQRRNPVCFCGHSHIPRYFRQEIDHSITPFEFEEGKPVSLQPNTKYLFNIGSIGQPRDGDSRGAFAVYDLAGNTITLHRFEYDIQTCQQKILQAGLPPTLAARLAVGK